MKRPSVLWLSCLVLAFSSCSLSTKDTQNLAEARHILSAEQQAKLTPQIVIKDLKEGNQRFVKNNLTPVNSITRIRNAAENGQFPEAVVLSCLDSRVPVEDVFQKGIGDLFVARVAGNIVNEDILGSLEYACKVSGSKVIIVLGHGDCGAINSAIGEVKLGNITTLLNKITPAVEKVKSKYGAEAKADNPEFVNSVCHENVSYSIDCIRKGSPILEEMEINGGIMIVGANYDIATGEVNFFDDKQQPLSFL